MTTASPSRSETSLSRDRAMTHALAAQRRLEALTEQWSIAGSLRRGRAAVHDIEHVLIPKLGPVRASGDLFETEGVLLWPALEELAAQGLARPHNYASSPHAVPSYRLGDKYRGYDLLFRGEWAHHEFFTSTPDTWGGTLMIRTGPWQLSQQVMVAFNKAAKYRQHEGQLIDIRTGDPVATPTERDYFAAAGLPFIEPHHRDQYARTGAC